MPRQEHLVGQELTDWEVEEGANTDKYTRTKYQQLMLIGIGFLVILSHKAILLFGPLPGAQDGFFKHNKTTGMGVTREHAKRNSNNHRIFQ